MDGVFGVARNDVAREDGLVTEAFIAAGLCAREGLEALMDGAGMGCQIAFLREGLAAVVPAAHPGLALFDGCLVFIADVEVEVALPLGDVAAAFAHWRVREGDVAAEFGVCGEAERALGAEGFGA